MQFRITPRFCLILIGVMLIAFSVSLGVSRRDLAKGADKLEQVYAEYTQLEQQIRQLREDLAYAQTDDYVERVARDELGMMRPGEIRYVSND